MRFIDSLRAFFSRGTARFISPELRIFWETMKLLDPSSAEKMLSVEVPGDLPGDFSTIRPAAGLG